MESNQGSIRLLEKYGFEKWGHMPRVAEFDGIEVGHLYYGLRIKNLLTTSARKCWRKNMKPEKEKLLALHLLAHKAKGYSILYVLNKSKFRYMILVLLSGLLIWGYLESLNIAFVFVAGMFIGALLRDIGWLRRIKGSWPFNLKVIDWKKVETIAEMEETLNKEDALNSDSAVAKPE